MLYENTLPAVFLDRPNRFIAHCEVNGKTETVHVKNTGRCRELLIPGCSVILQRSDNPLRKTQYDLISVYKENLGLVNIDSQVPNAAVKEWLEAGGFGKLTYLKPEYTFGKSRIDFYFEKGERKILMEVKGCTLEIEGKGYFPDAPTERGVKHLYELAGAVKQGYECYVAFVISMPRVTEVFPNGKTDPKFEEAFRYAEKNGVKMLFLPCVITENEISIDINYKIEG